MSHTNRRVEGEGFRGSNYRGPQGRDPERLHELGPEQEEVQEPEQPQLNLNHESKWHDRGSPPAVSPDLRLRQ